MISSEIRTKLAAAIVDRSKVRMYGNTYQVAVPNTTPKNQHFNAINVKKDDPIPAGYMKLESEDLMKDVSPEFLADIDTVCDFIDKINQLPYNCRGFNGIMLDDIQVPEECAELVGPKSIRLVAGNVAYADVCDREVTKISDLDFDDMEIKYTQALVRIRSLSKESKAERMINVGSRRVNLGFFDVFNKCVSDTIHNVEATESGYIPYHVDDTHLVAINGMVEISSRSVSELTMIKTYFKNLK